MALASDLMGLGMPHILALNVAEGGIGPLTIVGAGSSYATSTKIGADQRLCVSQTSAAGTCVGLPVVGGDAGAYLGDRFVIANAGTDSLKVFASTGVVIKAGDSSSTISVQPCKTLVVQPISSILWVGGILA